MADIGAKHRVIGIRHTLKEMREAGLVEEDSRYPKEAVADIKSELEATAVRWYKIGAKRGARALLAAFLDGGFEVNLDEDGRLEIVANVNEVSWRKALNITVGNEKRKVEKRKYKITLKDLEFDV